MLLYTFMGGLWAVMVTDYVQFIVLTLGVVVLFPLVFSRLGSFEALFAGAPADFASPVGGPITPLYVLAFYLLIMLSYNGNWAYAQRFYSVRDEREARKAGLLAVGLKIIGPPLFILPAMAARTLMPELMVPPNSPQYHLCGARARVPARRADGSDDRGDVLRDDVDLERRLQRDGERHHGGFLPSPDRPQRKSAKTGAGRTPRDARGRRTHRRDRHAADHDRAAWPLRGDGDGVRSVRRSHAGADARRIGEPATDRRGAAAGIVAGLIAGVSLFSYKTWWLVGRPDIDPNWLRYDYEALTIFTNVGVTIATMTIVTALETVHPDERRRIADFFVRLTRPKHLDAPTGTGGDEVFSPLPIIAQVTAGTGALLLIAAAVQSTGIGQMINIGAGTTVLMIAAGCYWLDRTMTRKPVPAVDQPERY